MWYIDALFLINLCVKHGILQSRGSCVFIYRDAGANPEESPEGWYLEQIDDVACELMNDEEGQRALISALQERGVAFRTVDKRPIELTDIFFDTLGKTKPEEGDYH